MNVYARAVRLDVIYHALGLGNPCKNHLWKTRGYIGSHLFKNLLLFTLK